MIGINVFEIEYCLVKKEDNVKCCNFRVGLNEGGVYVKVEFFVF